MAVSQKPGIPFRTLRRAKIGWLLESTLSSKVHCGHTGEALIQLLLSITLYRDLQALKVCREVSELRSPKASNALMAVPFWTLSKASI